jgi:hypothetical protein
MSAGGQGDPDFGAPAAERLVATLRRKPLTPRRAAVIIASYTTLVTFAGGLVAWLTNRKDFDSLGDACGGRCSPSPPWATATSSRAAGPAG